MDINLLEQKNELVRKIRMENDATVIHFVASYFEEVKHSMRRSFAGVPGLASTDEELRADIELAMDDIRNGRTITHEDLVKEMASW
jgi:hypothetical protein